MHKFLKKCCIIKSNGVLWFLSFRVQCTFPWSWCQNRRNVRLNLACTDMFSKQNWILVPKDNAFKCNFFYEQKQYRNHGLLQYPDKKSLLILGSYTTTVSWSHQYQCHAHGPLQYHDQIMNLSVPWPMSLMISIMVMICLSLQYHWQTPKRDHWSTGRRPMPYSVSWSVSYAMITDQRSVPYAISVPWFVP